MTAACILMLPVLAYRGLQRRSRRSNVNRSLRAILNDGQRLIGCCDREVKTMRAAFALVVGLLFRNGTAVVGAMLSTAARWVRKSRAFFTRASRTALIARGRRFFQIARAAGHVWRTSSWSRRGRWAATCVRRTATLAAIVVTAVPAAPLQTFAADRYWDGANQADTNNTTTGAGLGGNGTWDTASALWWNGSSDVAWNNAGFDTAIFWGSAGTITLGGPITAGGLLFKTSGYTVQADVLTLATGTTASPLIDVDPGVTSIINSQLSGTQGFTKTGWGNLLLTGANTSLSGTTYVNGGTLSLFGANAMTALGTDTLTKIVINGNLSRGTGTVRPGFGGGTLRLGGGYANQTFVRSLDVSGGGPGGDGAAFNSIGNNTLSGTLRLGAANNGVAAATYGTTIVSGTLAIGGGTTAASNQLLGSGNWHLTGTLSGPTTGQFQKSGTGTLTFGNTFVNNYLGLLAVQAGSIRLTNVAQLGNSVMGFNGGTFELRSDAPSGFSGVTLNNNATIVAPATSSLFVDRGIGGTAINQTVNFGAISNNTVSGVFTLAGRDGFGITVADFISTGNGNPGFSNIGNGTLTVNGGADNRIGGLVITTTARTLSMTATGEIVLNAGVAKTSGTATVSLAKGGTGTLYWTPPAGGTSTYDGTTNINAGTLVVNDLALTFGTNNTAATQINLGATTVTATLAYTGGGETTAKIVNLAGTTGGGIINASGTGALIFSSAFTAGGAGAKTLNLGGTSAAGILNEIQGAIVDSSTPPTNLAKQGSNTWVLSGLNTYGTATAAATTISGGTLQLKATATNVSAGVSDIIKSFTGSTIVFGTDAITGNGFAGGVLEYNNTTIGAATESLGILTPTAGFGAVKLSTSGGTPNLTFTSLGNRTAGATFNYDTNGTSGAITVTGATNQNGLLTDATNKKAYATINGVNWAAVDGSGKVTSTTYVDLAVDSGDPTLNYQLTVADYADSFGQTINSLKLAPTGPGQILHLNDVLGLSSGGVLFDNSNAPALIENDTFPTSTLNAAGAETIIITSGSSPGNALTISAPIGGGNGTLTKGGTGLLILSGDNVYTGNTVINQGTVRMAETIAGPGSIGAPAAATTFTLRQNALFDVDGIGASTAPYAGATALPILTIGALVGAGTIDNSSARNSAISIGAGTTTASGVFSGLLQNSGTGRLSVIRNGTSASVVALTGLNTYTGATILSGGAVLQATTLADIGTASSIGRGDAANAASNAASLIFSGGQLTYTGASATISQSTQAPTISINRLFTLAGNGTIDSSGTFGNNILATGVANHAALIFNNAINAVAFAGGSVGNNARTLTLQGTSTGDNEMGIQLLDQAGATAYQLSLTKAGTGLWILSNSANNYTGNTTIGAGAAGGILRAVDGVTLPSTSALVFNTATNTAGNGGVFETSGSFTRSVAAAATAGSVTWNSGANIGGGFSASDSKLVVALGGLASPPELTWGSGGFMTGGGNLMLSSATALSEVEFRNALNLGTAARTVQVDDNPSTATDFATITGVITSGAGGGLTKAGSGLLNLTALNTYLGNTTVQAGILQVTSLGNGAPGTGATSIGANGGVIQFGAAAVAGTLAYVGTGETTNRSIALVGTTGAAAGGTIDSSGSGALIFSGGQFNAVAGATKLLTLTGTNTDNNEYANVIKNDLATLINLSKTGSGHWLVSGANTFTGITTLSAGTLGVGHVTALGTNTGATSFTFNGGSVYFTNGVTSIANPVNLGATAVATAQAFVGQNSMTFSGALASAASTIVNTLPSGKTLTFNGTTTLTGALTVTGPGSTVFSGTVTGAPAFNFTVNALGGQVEISGTSDNTNTLATILTAGTLALGKKGALGTAGLTLTTGSGGTVKASTDLSGANKITGATVTTNNGILFFAGTNNMEFAGAFTNTTTTASLYVNNISGGALTFSASGNLTLGSTTGSVTFLGNGTTNISGTLTSATTTGGLIMSGSGTLNLAPATFANTGVLTVNNGTVNVSTSLAFATYNLHAGALKIDNQTNGNLSNRLGGNTKNMVITNGTFNFTANTAAGSSEALGTLTTGVAGLGGGGTINFLNAGSTLSTLSFTSLVAPLAGSTLNFTGATLGATNKITFGTAPTMVGNILPRFTVGGVEFATYDSTTDNTIKAFTGYNLSSNVDTAPAADTMKFTSTPTFTGVNAGTGTLAKTVNALNFSGDNLTLTGGLSNTTTLTLTAGGVLVSNAPTGNTISGPILALAAVEGVFHVNGTSKLTVNSPITGTGGLTKAGDGTLNLNGRLFVTGATTVNAGTLNLGGSVNAPPTATAPTLSNLAVNGTGKLDVLGNSQMFGSVASTSLFVGGTIDNSTAAAVNFFSASATATNFGGVISNSGGGPLTFYKQGAGVLTLGAAQTYTGATNIFGGGITLRENGALASATVNLNGGTLLLDNKGAVINNSRLAANLTLNLRSGSLTYLAALATPETVTIGATGSVNALQGANTITVTVGLNGSAMMTIGNLTRTAGGGTVNFVPTTGTLGLNGAANPQVILTQLNGAAPADNQFLGAWAIVNSTDYAAYRTPGDFTSSGVVAYGALGAPSYALQTVGATNVTPTAGTFGSGNVTNIAATATSSLLLNPGSTVTGALRLSGAFQNDLLFSNNGDVLVLEFGGLLRDSSANPSTIGAAAGNRGVLTAGTSASTLTELIAYVGSATGSLTINSAIKDTKNTTVGGAGVVSLVKSGPGPLVLSGGGVNTYSGGTVVQQGALNMTGATGIVIPAGGLTINNGATVTTVAAGNIESTNAVTINGSGTLTLVGANTLSRLSFVNNNHGAAAPTVAVGATSLALTAANAITSVNDNLLFTPTISGGTLNLTNSAPVIDVSGLSPNSLTITSIVGAAGGEIRKTGSGALHLGGANTFGAVGSPGFKLEQGTLILGVASTGTPPAITNGPVGLGTLTIGDGTTVMASAAITVGNAVAVTKDFTFGGLAATGNNLTFSGQVTLAPGAHTVTVTNPLVTAAVTGKLTGGTNLVKTGLGVLSLGSTANTNDFGGSLTIDAGTLSLAVSQQITDTAAVLLNKGAVFSLGAGLTETIGSLADGAGGGGLVWATATASRLTVGAANTNTTFSGTLAASTNTFLGLTKIGTGMLTLSGKSFYTGTTLVNEGTLRLDIDDALAATVITIANSNAAATLDLNGKNFTTTGLLTIGGAAGGIDTRGAVNIGSGGKLTLGGDFTFTSTGNPTNSQMITGGTLDLNGASRTFTIGDSTASTLEVSVSSLIQNGNIIKAGAGVLQLTNANNTYGNTNINAGVLSITEDGALGTTGTVTLNAATLQFAGTTSRAFAATRTLALTGAATFDVSNAATTYTIGTTAGGNTITAGGTVTKTGDGALALSQTLNLQGNGFVVNRGALNVTGTITGTQVAANTLSFGGSPNTAIVNMSGSLTAMGIAGAAVTGSTAVYNQTGGTASLTPTATNNVYVAGAGGYGYFNLTGGDFTVSGATGRFTVTQGASTGVAYIGGSGTLNVNNAEYILIGYNGVGALGQMTVGPGGTVSHNGSSFPFAINWTTNNNIYGVLNVAGGNVSSDTQPFRFGASTNTNVIGMINLAGGTLSTNVAFVSSRAAGGSGGDYVNFAGGTISTGAGIGGIIPVNANVATTATIFGPIANSASAAINSAVGTTQDFTGGLTVNTNGFNSTIAAVLSGATGYGVTQANLSVTGGSGYAGAPAVQFSAPSGGGVPAAGYALISGGQVAGIVITSPGTYANGETPTITLTGGGGTGASVTANALTTLNGVGGLTITGGGLLTLSGVNTYAGTTTVQSGTLIAGNANFLANSVVSLGSGANNGTLNVAGLNATVGGLQVTSGATAASQIVGNSSTTANGSVVVNTTLANSSFAGVIQNVLGAGTRTTGLTVTGTGSFTLAGGNTYTGATNVNGGTLAVAATGSLGNTAVAVASGATLAVRAGGGSVAIGGGTASVTLSGGSSFNMTDNATGTLNLGGTLSLGSGTTDLSFEIGSTLGQIDKVVVSGTATNAGTGRISILSLSGNSSLAVGSYNLITATGGLSGFSLLTNTLTINSVQYDLALDQSDSTALKLLVSSNVIIPNVAYWTGDVSGAWNAAGADTNWATTSAGGTDAGAVPGGTTDVFFTADSAANPSTTLGQDFTIKSLTFTGAGTTADATGFTIGGANTLSIATSAGITVQSAAAAHTISANVALGASQTWTNNSSGTLTVSGAIANGANDLSVTGSGNVTITGAIGSGGGSLTKSGSGTLTLGGNNTYAGGTNLNGGTIVLDHVGALATSGMISFGGGTLKFTANNTADYSARFSTAAAQTYKLDTNNQNVSLATGLTSGGGSLTKEGLGTLTLSGAGTYTGATNVNGGTLALASTASLGNTTVSVASGATFAARAGSGSIAVGSGSAGLSLAGGSALNLTDDAIGTLNLGGTLIVGGGTAANLSFEIGSALGQLDKVSVSGGATVNGGAISILALSGVTSLTAGSYDLITASGGLAGGFSLVTTTLLGYNLSLDQSSATALKLVVAENSATTLYWKGDVSGAWNVTGANTNWATTAAGTTDAAAIPGALTDVVFTADTANNLSTTLGQNFTIRSLSFTGAGTSAGTVGVTIAGGNTLTIGIGGVTVAAGSAAHTISAGVALAAAQAWNNQSTSLFTVSGAVNNGGNGLTVGGSGETLISGALSGAGDLTKNGGGRLILAADNAYGATTISAGTVQLGADGGGSTAGTLGTGAVAIATGASLVFNRLNDFTVANNVSGTGALVQNGAGAVTLGGDNSGFGGSITINSGVVAVASTTNLGTSAVGVTVDADAIFRWTGSASAALANSFTFLGSGGAQFEVTDGAAEVTLNGTISGNFTKTGAGRLSFGAGTTYSGTSTVTSGSLEVNSSITGTINLDGASTSAVFAAAGAYNNPLNLNGANSSVQFQGSGTTAFGGLITVGGAAGNTGTISAVPGLTVNLAGVVKDGRTAKFTGGGTIAVGGSGIQGDDPNSDVIVDVNTTLNIDAASDYNGPTSILSGGTLNANAVGAMPTTTRSDVTMSGANPQTFNLGQSQVIASLTGGANATVNLGANRTLTVGKASGTTVYSGTITSTAGGNLVKDGTSTLVLNGSSHAYSGATTVQAGTLTAKGSFATTAITVNTGATLSPGGTDAGDDGVGKLTAGTNAALQLNPTSSLVFEFKSAAGTAGADWDLIDLQGGQLIVNADNINPANRIKIYVNSWLPTNAGPGAAALFNAAEATPAFTQTYDWLFIAANSNAVPNPQPGSLEGRFVIDDSGVFGSGGPFTRPTNSMGQGTFSVRWVSSGLQGPGLYIHYSAVPEPTSLTLAGLASLAAAWYGRRRRKTNVEDLAPRNVTAS